MHDTELYRQILGLVSPWSEQSVTLDVAAQEITDDVDHPRGTLASKIVPRLVGGTICIQVVRQTMQRVAPHPAFGTLLPFAGEKGWG